VPATLAELLRRATERLAASSPTPKLDAEVLLRHAAGLTRGEIITRARESLAPEFEQRFEQLLEHRARGEPVAYLTGMREFWSLELQVTPDVLIPRPETELLVEIALTKIPPDIAWTIADLGTGSGAIALALARERPHCRVFATDSSPAALAVARTNAARHGIANIEFRVGAWLGPLTDLQFDLIASNPPYVAAVDPHLCEGDARFEPRQALVAGDDGLDAIREISASATARLRAGGWLVLEHGFDQAAAVRALLEARRYRAIVTHTDLAGHPRVTEAIRHPD
jgi:release factor glutamine methyltransferase